jgi:hypothetical protein
MTPKWLQKLEEQRKLKEQEELIRSLCAQGSTSCGKIHFE